MPAFFVIAIAALASHGCTDSSSTPVTPSDSAPILIGSPIANTDVFILDECQAPVPIGEKGELYIGGKGLAFGYLNDEKLTNEKNPGKFPPPSRYSLKRPVLHSAFSILH